MATPSPQIAIFLSSTFHHSNSSSSSISLATITIPSKKSILFHNPHQKSFLFHNSHKKSILFHTRLRTIPSATAEDAVTLEAAAVVDAAADNLVSTPDDGVSVFISALLFVAFIGLSVITFGVVYLGVKDYLQKKETEKYEKEAAAKSGKKKKKKVVRARAGPRGFGQKIDKDEDDD